jgi:hypothetical protein
LKERNWAHSSFKDWAYFKKILLFVPQKYGLKSSSFHKAKKHLKYLVLFYSSKQAGFKRKTMKYRVSQKNMQQLWFLKYKRKIIDDNMLG